MSVMIANRNFRPAGDSSDEEDDDFDGFSFAGEYKTEKECQREMMMKQYHERMEKNNSVTNQLHNAIIYGHPEKVMEILDTGNVDVNADLVDKCSPLYVAASAGQAAIVTILLNRGANPNYAKDGDTVLMKACECSRSSTRSEEILTIVTHLIEHGVDVKAMDRCRRTALMLASQQGFPDVVRALIPHSNLGAEDNQCWTALFYGVQSESPEVVGLLLNNGLKPEHTDARGNDVAYYAAQHDCRAILELLPKEENLNELVHYDDVTTLLREMGGDSEAPKFYGDVSSILCGAGCEELIGPFVGNGVGLGDILTATDGDLRRLGVRISFKRTALLRALLEFHGTPWNRRSIPFVPENEPFSSYDVLVDELNCLKQLIVMRGALLFVRNNWRDMARAADAADARGSSSDAASTIAAAKARLRNVADVVERKLVFSRLVDRAASAPADLIVSPARRSSSRPSSSSSWWCPGGRVAVVTASIAIAAAVVCSRRSS